jgi:hypothetical protein
MLRPQAVGPGRLLRPAREGRANSKHRTGLYQSARPRSRFPLLPRRLEAASPALKQQIAGFTKKLSPFRPGRQLL